MGLPARVTVFAGSAPLQWRVFVDHISHERHWSGALPAMSMNVHHHHTGRIEATSIWV